MTERFARIPVRAAAISLGAVPLRVLIAISGHADAEGRAYPGMGTIADATGIRREDVPRAIARLEQVGLLRRERAPGGRMTTAYVILFDGTEVSAPERTGGVRTMADRVSAIQQTPLSAPQRTGCPQECVQGVRTTADQTNNNIPKNISSSRKRADRAFDLPGAREKFERFVEVFPSRGPDNSNPKKPAFEKFCAAIRRGVDPDTMIRGAAHYAAAMHRQATPGKFIKTMEVWLSKACWQQFADLEAESDLPLAAGMI
jgi:hypothetical protein